MNQRYQHDYVVMPVSWNLLYLAITEMIKIKKNWPDQFASHFVEGVCLYMAIYPHIDTDASISACLSMEMVCPWMLIAIYIIPEGRIRSSKYYKFSLSSRRVRPGNDCYGYSFENMSNAMTSLPYHLWSIWLHFISSTYHNQIGRMHMQQLFNVRSWNGDIRWYVV